MDAYARALFRLPTDSANDSCTGALQWVVELFSGEPLMDGPIDPHAVPRRS